MEEEDPDLLLAFDFADAVVAAVPLPRAPPAAASSVGSSKGADIQVEPRSKLRMCQWEFPPTELAVLLAGRTVLTIQAIAEDAGVTKRLLPTTKGQVEWSTIGVLGKRFAPKAAPADGTKRATWVLTDYKVRVRQPLVTVGADQHALRCRVLMCRIQ
jgi:hypothetical protein